MLPSTKIAVSNLDTKLPLEISASLIPDYPFFHFFNASLAHPTQTNLKIKITPISEQSGLKGMNLGNVPVLSTWIKESISRR
tara:strand:+ start:248 stop:493 length:246 start_codon:yes stop_codon:yes gene_type:complete